MSTFGALAGLLLAILLIIRRVSPVYSLVAGALAGGLIGGFGLEGTVGAMIVGIKDIVPAIIRIITAGVLSGVLIETGAATSISNTIIRKLGSHHVYLALALSTMLLTGIGVFIDVAVITVAPIALMIGHKLSISRLSLLIVMIGGGKCGNIISPNPNTIIAAENFGAPLSSVMFVNILPALVGLLFTVYIIARLMPKRKDTYSVSEPAEPGRETLPSFRSGMVAPVVTILLLALRPLCGVVIDPLIALPAGGIAGVIAMRRWNQLGQGMKYGLEKMSVVAVLLVGTGAIAGIIKESDMTADVVTLLAGWSAGEALLAPIAGILMSAATASTTAGATIASSSFGQTILAAGVNNVWAAAMVNSGATVLDHLPHGSFFHATGGSVELGIKARMRLIPYESAVGLVLVICTTIGYFIIS